ncbi:TetR/AcrR family transcriptional regulator [Planomonospora sp. ID67723]|uniref:TetR/AcrR family transcriptional regulator n=1 Tax=Planomonospora sp. ID67723 TaxID=2738134 RepID=UPI0018C3D9C1|nr:TetR family transcriptional regulator [Planomonospora sp. ID67723]
MSPRTPSSPSAPARSGRGARGGYTVGDVRRRRIIEVAIKHFADRGYHAASLTRIAEEVGITQPGVLHHFRTKEQLMLAVLEHRDALAAEREFAEEPGSAAEALRALVRLAEFNTSQPGLLRMFTTLAGEAADPAHPAHAYFTGRYAMVLGRVEESLRKGSESGELRAGIDHGAIAREIAAVMDGLQIQWCLRPDSVDMVGQFRDYADRLVRSVTPDGRGLGEPSAGPAPAAVPPDPPAPGPRAAQERSGSRRAAILLAALEVFAERGFRGASLAAVAERAGLSQQGLLHYFPNKERLLVDMLDLRERIDSLRMLAETETSPRLEHIVQLAEYNATRPGVLQAFTVLAAESVTDDHPARDYFAERYARMRELGERALRAELGDALPGGLTPAEGAALLLAVQDGVQLQWLLDPEAVGLPSLVGAFARLLKAHS